jgi:eukaryotic-like serine/threonine-protein kinase
MTVHTACPACGSDTLDIDPRCPTCGEALTSEEALQKIGTTVLEHYEITDVLGQGGMSVVYRARHKLTEQEVALKILPPELAAHNQVKSRFLEEARALAQLDHPNIVHLYNFGQDQGCLVLAMQLVAGQTWERLILTRGRLDWPTTVSIGIDVLKALELAHSRGVVHRDMKPSNVLVRADGSALVMDFGIAKMTTSTRLTATGQTMGTVRYMSPEQVRGQEVDVRTDLYSLAITLYESLCGDTPFDGESHFEIMTQHLTAAPPPLSERGVQVPAALEQVIMTALRKHPDQRPASARQMRAQLEEVRAAAGLRPATDRSTQSDRPAPVAPARGERRRLWMALAGGAVLVAAVAVFAIVELGSDDGEVAPASAGTSPAARPTEVVPALAGGPPDRGRMAGGLPARGRPVRGRRAVRRGPPARHLDRRARSEGPAGGGQARSPRLPGLPEDARRRPRGAAAAPQHRHPAAVPDVRCAPLRVGRRSRRLPQQGVAVPSAREDPVPGGRRGRDRRQPAARGRHHHVSAQRRPLVRRPGGPVRRGGARQVTGAGWKGATSL